MNSLPTEPLHISFYGQPVLQIAKQLLGKILVKETTEGTTAGYIVETEAYMGPLDQAAHSYRNRRTKRTEVMFGEAGHAYVYTMHTHCLVNVVCGAIDEPHAVLIRAIEPCFGIELMKVRRGNLKKITDLTSGPGKLTKAMNIHMNDYGQDLTKPPLYIAEGKTIESIACGPRIGIDNSGEARDYPWRFWEDGNPYVSR